MSRPVPKADPDRPLVYVCEAETGRSCDFHRWGHLCTLDADHGPEHECACGHEWTHTDDD